LGLSFTPVDCNPRIKIRKLEGLRGSGKPGLLEVGVTLDWTLPGACDFPYVFLASLRLGSLC
jgi:hypothetical protein